MPTSATIRGIAMMDTKDSRGFTMIEMVVVLAVIAILAAVLTPVVTGYVERARFNAAQNDVKNIAAAIVQFNTDTRLWPIYVGSSDIPNGNVFDVLRSPGDTPAIAAATGWGENLTTVGTTVGGLETVLNTNYLTLPLTGSRAWRGAYLQLGSDPWGSAYYVTAKHLKPSADETAFVISAGANQTIDTDFGQLRTGAFVSGTDDIVQRIR
jgi:prepilin-type N-terminal cleavage/methylation domain-containing protein